MTKYRTILVSLFVLCIGLTPLVVTHAELTQLRAMRYGARGTNVLGLQQQLVSLGYLSSDNATGYFGALTRAAVRQFQCEHMSICSGTEDTTGYGNAGPRTLQAIAVALSSGSTQSSVNTTPSSASQSTIQATIAALLAQIQVLQAKIAALTGSASSGTTATTQTSTSQASSQTTTTTSNTNSTATTQTTTTSYSSCTFNGQTIAHGANVTAYQAAAVAYGTQCVSQTRTCSNGTLSGSYGYASCTVAVGSSSSLSCSSNLSCFANAVNNLFAHFWTGARDTGHIIPTGWKGEVGGSFDGSDWRGSTWPGALFVSTMYTQYLLNPTDANAQPIRAQWNYLKSRFSDSDFTAVGASAPMNVWSDDLSTNMQMLLEIHKVTNDEKALTYAKTALQNGWNRWHNTDPRFGGALWYTDDHNGESLHQVQYALVAWRVYELTGDQTFLAKSQEIYNWIQSRMSHADDVYYMDYGWWDSDNRATDAPHVNWWGSIHEGRPNNDVSQSYIGGVMGMNVMHARMYRVTGDEQYKTRTIATARGIIKNFVGTNGAFFSDRDAWTDGAFVRYWVLEVYPLLPSDVQQQFKTAFQKTATAIQTQNITSDGYYGPCWSGPVDCVWSNLAADQHNKQSMTNTQAVNMIATPALIDYAETHPVSVVTPPVTAVLLGTDGNDVVGTKTVGADGIGDVHIKLSGVTSPITTVVITPTSGAGTWRSPADGTNWIVSVTPQSDVRTVDLYFEYYQAYTSYQVSLTFQNGTTQTITVQ